MRDYYKILGIPYSADEQQIKKAYRQLVKQYHPDKNEDEQAVALFREMKEAYEVLSHPQSKAQYDIQLFKAQPNLTGRKKIKSPEQLLAITQQLVDELKKIDGQKIDQNNLYFYMSWLLEKDAVFPLLHGADHALTSDFFANCIFIQRKLSLVFQIPTFTLLLELAQALGLKKEVELINKDLSAAKKIEKQRKMTPLWVVLIASAILGWVYFLGKK